MRIAADGVAKLEHTSPAPKHLQGLKAPAAAVVEGALPELVAWGIGLSMWCERD